MSHFTGYGAYLVYVTIRTHFESPTFDFFKHHKVKAKRHTYEERNDRWFFDKVAREYETKDLRDFFIANRLENRNYITELIEDDAKDNYMEYKRRIESLSYNFATDLDKVFKHGLKKPFELKEDQYPYLVGLYLRRVISPETMVIIDDFLPFIDKFDKYLGTTDFIWSRVALKLRKYRPFLKYDGAKFKRILKEKVHDTRRESV